MTDPFTDVADELMTRSTDLGNVDSPPPNFGGAKTRKHVCPYCGAVTAVVDRPTGPCPKCNMEDTPATRAATKARIGPWYVLQTRNPSAPGMKWATLLSLVSKGQVTPRSVVRGPTTHQLWKFAAHVKGLSREFNLCYSCGGEIERAVNQCPHCDRLQEPPVNPDALLESRDMAARGPVQREVKMVAAGLASPDARAAAQNTAPQSNDMVLAGSRDEESARKRNPSDGILSARELAAAFQLDFNPPPNNVVQAPARARRRGPARALVALILLAAAGGAALLAAKPDYRAKTFAWANTQYASIQHLIGGDKKPNAIAPEKIDSGMTAANDAAPAVGSIADAAPPKVESAPAITPGIEKSQPVSPPESRIENMPSVARLDPQNPRSPIDDSRGEAHSETPKTAATPDPILPPDPPRAEIVKPEPHADNPVAEAPVVPTPAPVEPRPRVDAAPIPPTVESPAPAVAMAPPAAEVKPDPAPQVPQSTNAADVARVFQQSEKLLKDLNDAVPASIDTQITLGKRLRDGAFDADRIKDYPLEIRCYEKIKQLDPAAWPMKKSVLDGYIDYANSNIPH